MCEAEEEEVVVVEEEEEQEGQSRREEKKENSEDWGLQNSRRVCPSTKKDFQTKFTHNLLHLCRTTNRYIYEEPPQHFARSSRRIRSHS